MKAASEIRRVYRAFKCPGGVSLWITRINVRFVVTEPFQLKIKYAMKTLAPIQHKPFIPSLFHIASPIEDFTPNTHSKSVLPPHRTPFADLMLHPDKLEAALKNAKSQNDAFDASRKFSRSTTKRVARNAPCESYDARQPSCHSRSELKITEFHVKAPFAKSVKLAADFTDWEKFPLDLIKSEDGVWYADVPLSPGQYAYRFIVDGRWHDDPHPAQLVPNPFGTINAVVKVA
jgi:hypothetical protein